MRRELAVAFVALGCQSAPIAPSNEPVPTMSAGETPVASVQPRASAPPVASSGAPAEDPPPSFAGGRFPPADLEPPQPRSAKEGDGRWVRLGNPGDRAAEDPPLLYTTVIHPHPVSKFDSVTVVAIDLARTELHFVPGAGDPGADALAPPAGLVPREHHDALLAVFNGGWLPKHGNWGMMARGTVLVPPKENGCTIGVYRDGRVRIGGWPALASDVEAMRAYRQTPPCMIENGKLHPWLEAKNDKPWGGHNPNDKTRRRSSVGIDASGRVLFYGFGIEVGAELLARGLLHAGAVAAAELDINWTWTRFLLYGTPGGELSITSTLVPKMTHTKKGYVVRRDERDFFYLVRRARAVGGR
jgi:hypothetical protein